MGHENFSDTAYYVHLVPELLNDALGATLERLDELLPEVEYEA
jgi:hypothetical protein